MKKILILHIVLGITTLAHATNFYIPAGDVNALRAAINTANTNNAADTIHLFPYSTYKFTTVDHTFIGVSNVLPQIQFDGNTANSLTILGNGAKLVLDRSAVDKARLLFVYSSSTLHIYDLAFINGRLNYSSDDGGGALYVSMGEVKLFNCLFQGNEASKGGAIFNGAGLINIENCTFTENEVGFLGTAIYSMGGTIWIKNSVLVNNTMRESSSSEPSAVYCLYSLFSPGAPQILISYSVLAKNTLQNVHQYASLPNNGKEFNIAENQSIYTLGYNYVGAHDNTSTGHLPAFVPCLPCGNSDSVGTRANLIDPSLDALARHYDYQDTYSFRGGKLKINHFFGNIYMSGYSSTADPAIASYGIFPGNGEEGDEITIYGKNLSTISKIQFAGAEVTSGFTKTDTSLVVTVPAGVETGKITVVNASMFSATSHQKFKIGADPVTGTDPDEVVEEFSFYPNPVTTDLFVNTKGSAFSIIDLMGREILTSNAEKVDVSNFLPGMYLIKCGSGVRRFIKD